jgi:O-antigen ligase
MMQFWLLLALFMLPVLNKKIRGTYFQLLGRIPRFVLAAMTVIFVLGVLSAIVNSKSGMHLANSFSDIALLYALFFAVFVVAACRLETGHVFSQVVVGLMALTVIAVGFQELIGVAAAHANGMDFNYEIALLHFSKPRFYNQFQSWAIPVVSALPILFPGRRSIRWLSLLALALLWYVLLMTAGRGTLVALFCSFVFALVFLPSIRSYLVKWQSAGILAGALIYIVVLVSFGAPGIQNGEANPTPDTGKSRYFAESLGRPMMHTSGRFWMWTTALEDVKKSPLLGIGPYNYSCTRSHWYGHPHSFPVQFAAEWGLIAATAMLLVFAWLFLVSTRAVRKVDDGEKDESLFPALLLVSFLTAMIHACLSGVLIMPASQVTGILVCGLLLGSFPLTETCEGHSFRPFWALVFTLLISVFLLFLGRSELNTMQERAEKLPPRIIAPRIWQNAKVCTVYVSPDHVTN